MKTTATTDQEGRYQVVHADSGKLTLTVEGGVRASSRTLTVTDAGNTTLDVKLRVAINERIEVRSGLVGVSLDSDRIFPGSGCRAKRWTRCQTIRSPCCKRFGCSRRRPVRARTW